MSGRRRSQQGRRRTPRPATSPEAQLALVKQARSALPTLPTESLYRVHALLESILAAPDLDADALAELRRALEPPAR